MAQKKISKCLHLTKCDIRLGLYDSWPPEAFNCCMKNSLEQGRPSPSEEAPFFHTRACQKQTIMQSCLSSDKMSSLMLIEAQSRSSTILNAARILISKH